MNKKQKNQWSTVLLAAVAIIFTLALVFYPKQGFQAGISGLKVFWDIVFPSLLPFFVLAEILLGLGVVRGVGVLLEPLMRPLFSVPGVGAFALSMGLAAGYPMDAVITARFRETNQCSRIEGERLLAFTNTADPLFMFGAVAVGMFSAPAVGALLAIAHYISSFLVGVVFKFWGRREERELRGASTGHQAPVEPKRKGSIFLRAYREMIQAHTEDGRPFGKLLGNAVTESIQTLLMICGFIVFFAVLIEILRLSGMIRILGWPVALVYHLFGIHDGLVPPTIAGLLELDIGTAQTAQVVAAPLIQKLALASGIIAWSGLAVHAQVASVLTQTDIRMRPYFLARLLHGGLAAFFTVLFYRLGMGKGALTSFAAALPFHNAAVAVTPAATTVHFITNPGFLWHVMSNNLIFWLDVLGFIAIVAISFIFLRQVKILFSTRN